MKRAPTVCCEEQTSKGRVSWFPQGRVVTHLAVGCADSEPIQRHTELGPVEVAVVVMVNGVKDAAEDALLGLAVLEKLGKFDAALWWREGRHGG